VANKAEPFLSGLVPSGECVSQLLSACGPWRLTELLSPRAMAARMLPHEPWREEAPPILSFYSYAAAELMPPPVQRQP
jgi:hypothetical protein